MSGVVRPSSKAGQYAVSYKTPQGKIEHTAVEVVGSKFMMVDTMGMRNEFGTMAEALAYLQVTGVRV
jgi:hypothetical protein